ncbi:hypothetical protein JCM3775_005356 [Rhodotorula graminis]
MRLHTVALAATLATSSPLVALAAALQLPFAPPSSLADSSRALQQPDSTPPVDYPYRQLPWGEVNVLATTDTHGWLLGHQRNEPSFSGDWGDYYSFVQRMKEEARRRGVDLLLVDAGDRVDGNGLVDAEPPPHPKGYTALEIFSRVPYDVVTTGNHELYKYPVASYVSTVMHDKFGDRWVVSNVNITAHDDVSGREVERLLGNRMRRFETEQGREVVAFGPLFDFKAHAAGLAVQAPSRMVKEPWFREAIATAPDIFLLVGHMSLRTEPDSEWSAVVRAIREVHPTVPVLVFGGHHHIRDCVQEDECSMSLAAGRYFETVGFMSASGLNDSSKPPTFKRRYIDQNRNSYEYHVGKGFDTPEGKAITKELSETARRFNLTEQFGVAPQDYFLHRFPHTDRRSIFRLLTESVLPQLITRPDRPAAPYLVLNTGSIRFDLFKGPFTRGDQWQILPFANNFLFLPSVPRARAAKLLHHLNVVGEHRLASTASALTSASAPETDEERAWLAQQSADVRLAADAAALEHAHRRASSPPLSPSSSSSSAHEDGRLRMRRASEGYVTLDACGGSDPVEQLGDDTLHRPYRSARQPIFVATALPAASSIGAEEGGEAAAAAAAQEEESWTEPGVDVVFFDFIAIDVVRGLNALGGKEDGGRYRLDEIERYVEWVSANTLLEEYAKRAWS